MKNIKTKLVSISFLIVFCFLSYNISRAATDFTITPPSGVSGNSSMTGSSPQPNDPTAKTTGSWWTNLFNSKSSDSANTNTGYTSVSGSGYNDTGYTTVSGNSNSSSGSANTCNLSNVTNLKSLITNIIKCLLNPLVVLMVGLSIIIFIWGVFKFIRSDSGSDDKSAGRAFMFWGIVGIFVMISLWGLVNVLQHTFVLSGDDITPRQININL